MKDNQKKALESGNVLTQTIQNGELVNIKNVNTIENKLGDDICVADVRKELFEGDNIVIDKNSDHGLSELSENKVISEEVDIANNIEIKNKND